MYIHTHTDTDGCVMGDGWATSARRRTRPSSTPRRSLRCRSFQPRRPAPPPAPCRGRPAPCRDWPPVAAPDPPVAGSPALRFRLAAASHGGTATSSVVCIFRARQPMGSAGRGGVPRTAAWRAWPGGGRWVEAVGGRSRRPPAGPSTSG